MKKILFILLILIASVYSAEGCYDFRSCEQMTMEVYPSTDKSGMLCRQEEGIAYKNVVVKIGGIPFNKVKSYNGVVCRHVEDVKALGNGRWEVTLGYAKIREDNFSSDQYLEMISTPEYGCRENFFFTVGCDQYVAEKNGYKFVGKMDDQHHVSGYCHLPNGMKKHVTNVSDCVML